MLCKPVYIHISGLRWTLSATGHAWTISLQHHCTWKIWGGGDHIKYVTEWMFHNVHVEFVMKQSIRRSTGFEVKQKS